MRRIAILGALAAAWAMPSMATLLRLTSDLGLQGSYRYCEYGNAKVYGVDAAQPCPSSIEEPAANGKGLGFFKEERHEGTNKLCVYRVGGQDRTIPVETNASCPLNQEF